MPILDTFGSQYISNTTENEFGLMSSDDKSKLDEINLDDINYINKGLKDIQDYMIPQFIYGIKIDTTNPNPDTCVEYIDDSIGFIPLKVDTTTGDCSYGSWKNIIEDILGIQPCLVKPDGEVIFKLDPYNYNQTIDGNTIDITSGEFGQVMIRFKHIYYKFSVEERYIKFQISNKQVDHTWIDTAFISEDGIATIKQEMFVSAYEAVQKNNILQSVSNESPVFNLDYTEIESLSEFGVFHMINAARKQFIIFLGYLVTKSIDLEKNIGNGNSNGPILNTGTMNDKGLFYGTNTTTDGVKLFGIENLWGNQLKYMHGIIQKLIYAINHETDSVILEQHIFTKNFYPYDNINDYEDAGPIDSINGYVSNLRFLSTSTYIPGEVKGSTNTYYKSYFHNEPCIDIKDIHRAVYGGNNTYGDKIGSEFLLLGDINSANTSVTTHLIY